MLLDRVSPLAEDGDGFYPVELEIASNVTHSTTVLGDVTHHRGVRVEFGWGHLPAREDLLLPVAAYGGYRPLENLSGKPFPHTRRSVEIRRLDVLTISPARDPLEEQIGQKCARFMAGGILWVHDDLEYG